MALLQDHEGSQLYVGIENPVDWSNYRSLKDPTYDIGEDPHCVLKPGPLRVWVADQLVPPVQFFPVGSPVEKSFLALLEQWAKTRGVPLQDADAIIGRRLSAKSTNEEITRLIVLEMVLLLRKRAPRL